MRQAVQRRNRFAGCSAINSVRIFWIPLSSGAPDRIPKGFRPETISSAEGTSGAVGDAASGGRAGRAAASTARAGDLCRGVARPAGRRRTDVCHPTSYAGARPGRATTPGVDLLPARGFATSMTEFADWAMMPGVRRRLLMEDHYRLARRRLDVLMDGDEPVGGRWNFDADNRKPPPKAPGTRPVASVCPSRGGRLRTRSTTRSARDLDRWAADGDVGFIGVDGPRRFPATPQEALAAFHHFVDHRLAAFGPYEDAMLAGDPWMAHSLMSSSAEPRAARSARSGAARGKGLPGTAMSRSPRPKASSVR